MALGPLIILSGPSGSGKSTVVHKLLAESSLPLRESVSVTTRLKRPGEVDGVDYYFWPVERFEEEVRAGSFLEWAQVYGSYYGTLRREVDQHREQGIGVILVIDVQGAAQVRRHVPDAVSIFLRASSMEAYRQRLLGRGTEDEAAMNRRIQAAEEELKRLGEYDQEVINDDLCHAVGQLEQLIAPLF